MVFGSIFMQKKSVPVKRIVLFTTLMVVGMMSMIDMYSPALPDMARQFGVDNTWIQLTVGTYLLGLAFMPLFFGPISDVYGRKRVACFGLMATILSTILVSFSTNIFWFCFFRFIQGCSAGGLTAVSRPMIRDVARGRTYARYAAYVGMAIMTSPTLSPALGGYLNHWHGWRLIFWFLAVYFSILLVAFYRYCPETLPLEKRKDRVHWRSIGRIYLTILENKTFLKAISLSGTGRNMGLVFVVMAPFVLQEEYHRSALYYGWVCALLGLANIIGLIVNNRLLKTEKSFLWLITFGLGLLVSVDIAFVLVTGFMPDQVILFVLLMTIMAFASSFVGVNSSSIAMNVFDRNIGAVNAVFQTVAVGCAVLLSFILAHTGDTALHMAWIYSFIIMLLLCITWRLKKEKPQ
jgi:MFS transporter, DHA1 family, multidrug resistance protein